MGTGFFFSRVVPKGLDHTLSVIIISLYVYVCVCTKVVPTQGVGGWDHFGFRMVRDGQ